MSGQRQNPVTLFLYHEIEIPALRLISYTTGGKWFNFSCLDFFVLCKVSTAMVLSLSNAVTL